MTPDTAGPQPETEPGTATAEGGLVFLEGPDGVAATMTADAAARTGQRLIDAATVAATQQTSGSD
ncbi:hypothetical protein [Sphingopyxis sp.]|jgi:MoxR-like ATPase|uniref:hypothetical protein n=1 Tax=Sphingopyxis sp. TaxID=1908224 RepID=UPI0025F3D368|nr:hypothetical protein [Sphingopyxis sp.]MBK6413062.1 hypothetical protein [Sphingopyxis sp.]